MEQAIAAGQPENRGWAPLLHAFKSPASGRMGNKGGVSEAAAKRPDTRLSHAWEDMLSDLLPLRFPLFTYALSFSSLSVNVEHPKWLNLLPGLGTVPAPWGAVQAGGPPAHPGFPKAQRPWVSAGIKQLLSLSPPHLPWIDSINCQPVDILMRIMSCGIPFDFDMPQFVNT